MALTGRWEPPIEKRSWLARNSMRSATATPMVSTATARMETMVTGFFKFWFMTAYSVINSMMQRGSEGNHALGVLAHSLTRAPKSGI